MTSAPRARSRTTVPLWRDVRFLEIAAQAAVVVVIGLVVWFMVSNMMSAMSQRNLGFGFSFLGRQAGFEISESPIPYSSRDTYGTAFIVGLLNTLFVSFLGIILATVLGLIVGVARLSPNWLVARIAAGYVEIIRNTPLLVQLVLIYFAVLLQLPSVSSSITIGEGFFLNQRGVFVPGPQVADGFGIFVASIVIGIVGLIVANVVAGRREDAGKPSYRMRTIATARPCRAAGPRLVCRGRPAADVRPAGEGAVQLRRRPAPVARILGAALRARPVHRRLHR